MPSTVQLRPFQQVHADRLYPADSPLPDHQECDRRHRAVAEVFRRLPEEAYQGVKKIKASKRSFTWFIPDLGTEGLVYPFHPNMRPPKRDGLPITYERHGDSILSPYAKVVYLAPFLELRGWDHLVYVVSHELAHVVLRHSMYSVGEQHDRAEREVFRQVCAWGFEWEARKAEAKRKEVEDITDNPATVKLPEEAVQVRRLALAAGIEVGPGYPEEQSGEVCFQFFASGDVELFLRVARRNCRVAVEKYDDGEANDPSFRVMLLVFVPIADLSQLVEAFTEYGRLLRV